MYWLITPQNNKQHQYLHAAHVPPHGAIDATAPLLLIFILTIITTASATSSHIIVSTRASHAQSWPISLQNTTKEVNVFIRGVNFNPWVYIHQLFSKQVLLSWKWLTYAAQAYQSGINLHHFIKGPAFHLLVQVFTWSTWMHHDISWRLQPWIGFDLMDVRHSACSHPVWKSFNCTCMSAFYVCSNLLGYWKFASCDGLVPIAWFKGVFYPSALMGLSYSLNSWTDFDWKEQSRRNGHVSSTRTKYIYNIYIYIYVYKSIYIHIYIYIYIYIYVHPYVHPFHNNLPWSKCGGLVTHDFLVFHKMSIYAGLRSIDVRGLNSTLRLSFPTGGRKAKGPQWPQWHQMLSKVMGEPLVSEEKSRHVADFWK